MSIGTNISVISLGAIMAFATRIHSSEISVQAVGAVLMVVGVISLIMQLDALAKRRRLTAAQAEVPGPAVAVRVRGRRGRTIRVPDPYAETTAEPLRRGVSPYQSPGEYNGNEW